MAPSYDKTFTTALGGVGKQANLAPLEEMHSPFGGWRHHLSPASGGTITRAYCRAIYEKIVSRCFILPPEQGWQGNTIRKGAKRPENRVTRFPVDAQRT